MADLWDGSGGGRRGGGAGGVSKWILTPHLKTELSKNHSKLVV